MWMGSTARDRLAVSAHARAGVENPAGEGTMAREPMSQNQKFALLVFALVLLVGVALVYIYITSGINSML